MGRLAGYPYPPQTRSGKYRMATNTVTVRRSGFWFYLRRFFWGALSVKYAGASLGFWGLSAAPFWMVALLSFGMAVAPWLEDAD
jgi:hypothetical protein